ncbi:hypothetical protein K8R03_01605 [Candidatus Kaiserbacteria bacterium]|nr:hypothetical protein [Candidatus Kaiserbacteria bacterium]
MKKVWTVILIASAVLAWYEWPLLVRVEEGAQLASHPSPQLAYELGERHFDARRPRMYDIERALHLFSLAASLDPTLPNAYHELARIDFLKGNFNSALAKINFQISMHGDEMPNSYYIRGLIEGYMGDYAASAKDYEHYLTFDSHNWAAINDYAWVLLKDGRAEDAAVVTTEGLILFPDNPWLLNSQATALYEMNANIAAFDAAKKASVAVAKVTEKQWLTSYPGNDPKIAAQGVASFKKAVADNMHTMQLAVASSTVQ